jgi:putative endonuclease
MLAWVYMLLCADGSYYVGSSRHEDLGIRISEHEAGTYAGYTKSRRPVRLVWCEHFPQITDAVLFERQLKGWSRAKKEALIRGDWDAVHALARRRAGAPRLNPRPSRPPSAAPQDED